ncbi:SDR family NAD(P)-dependent oxidoreductase [Hydrocarboniclastica marina]|uniref:SDR family NAD(P)-dependent oxidoreductase n=1 Tax=Hydrocarboniclastica marina TaxID=2259620 RepID=A0A4P7XFS7_9ALTE|nr:SDR family NAD(P)-dependent oxidoreductase [Hydrocarboniclastica marina]MAL97045.1 short-chain dehydrogenase [Alteromonadaceae bacterium]QCF25463.1 SDR family NAD(P)-dependent oxidoreductase [Hydrocarboniclastica marina]|tara:strand:- start:264 stop:1085 length:822 start_codon:yes stop_codon:yes gene_type:complete
MHYFQNKVAIVTGGGGDGIGNSLVLQLAQAGARVAFCDVAGLDKTEAELKKMSAPWLSAKVDIGDKAAVNAFVDQVLEKFGQIDILINNAGVALGDRSFDEVTEADFEKITNINYWGVIHTTQRCYPHLLKRPQAAIVNLSSSQGILALPYLVPYCTTKFAVRGFTDALRAEHKIRGVHNVSVHTVHPGAVATNITLNADYHNSATTQQFHKMLQKGTSREKAAELILNGIRKKRGRIFISDGHAQDILARLLPSAYVALVKLTMRWRGITFR